MKTDRKIAIAAGILYIIGTVSGVLSVVLTQPVRMAEDFMISVSMYEQQIIIGALFVFTMGIALAMVPVVVYPVLHKFNQTLATGYLVFRGALETVTYMVMTVGWLLLIPLSEFYLADTINKDLLQYFGSLLFEAKELGNLLTVVFIIGALMFYYILYRSKLIPRWISGWGLLAAIPYLTAAILGIFGVLDSSISSSSQLHTSMVVPLALQEMVMALWFIVKGFNPAVIASVASKDS